MIQVFTPEGEFERIFGRGQDPSINKYRPSIGRDGLGEPTDLTFDWNGNLHVLDNRHHRVQVFEPNSGKPLFKYSEKGSKDGHLNNPHGMTLDTHGNVLISDSQNNRMCVFNPSGVWLKTFPTKNGQKPEIQLSFPIGVSCDPQTGDIYVAENYANRIHVFDSQGISLRTFGTINVLSNPRGLVVDRTGRVVVVDSMNNRIVLFSREGELLEGISSEGKVGGKLDFPMKVALDKKGEIYVTEYGNSRVTIFN